MKKYLLLCSLSLCAFTARSFSCDCTPAFTEETLDDKLYTGANPVFFTAEILAVESAFHLEVTVQITEIFYGAKFIKDPLKPVTVYFDLRTACAITQPGDVKAGNKLFITSTYNTMGRMLITNNCDAYFPMENIDTFKLREYLVSLKAEG